MTESNAIMLHPEYPSPNFDQRPADAAIDHLVLHYTGMISLEAARSRLCDPMAKVSAHYLIDEFGRIEALVRDSDRAWHAGVSDWRGVSNLNDRSIGIEMSNPGHEHGYRAFPEPQIIAVIGLCRALLTRHPIMQQNIVAHSDIAPTRKNDPGELFPWQRLAAHGIGLWPTRLTAGWPVSDLATNLSLIGYSPDAPLEARILAFQRRFLPANCTGQPDPATVTQAKRASALYASQSSTTQINLHDRL